MAGYNPRDIKKNRGAMSGLLDPDGSGKSWDDEKNRDAVYKPSTRYSGVGGELVNFGTDILRNLGNFYGNTSLRGRPTPQGGGLGDSAFGSNPADFVRTGGLAKGLQQRQSPVDDTAGGAAPSLMDIMSQLGETFPGSPGGIVENPFVSYDPMRDRARSNADASRAALSSIYSQMQNEIGNAGEAIENRYADAGKDIAADRDETAANVKDAYASSANQQADIARTLGIENAVAQAIDEGRDVSSRGADVQSRVAERGQGNLDYNTAVGASEGTYNDRLGQAASFQGANQQSQLQNKLLDRLAEIDMAEQQANQNRFSSYEGSGPGVTDLFQMAKYIDESNREGQMANLEMQQGAYRDAQRDPANVLAQLGALSPQLQQSGIPEEYAKLFIEQMLKGSLGR